MNLLIRHYIPPFTLVKEKNKKYNFIINTWVYDKYCLITGDLIKLPILYEKYGKIVDIFLNIKIPRELLKKERFKKNRYFYFFELPINYLIKNEDLNFYLITELDNFRTKESYDRDMYFDDYVAELYDEKLWIFIEKIIAKLEKRDHLNNPRQDYVIYSGDYF